MLGEGSKTACFRRLPLSQHWERGSGGEGAPSLRRRRPPQAPVALIAVRRRPDLLFLEPLGVAIEEGDVAATAVPVGGRRVVAGVGGRVLRRQLFDLECARPPGRVV